jgi:hypothetical protein
MNRLIHETSPYLRQHADNPVDWYAWKPEAFARAKAEDKPILVSIGYSTCHWCHVMAHESFEDEAVAALMNRHFINIKVDREERPDIDQIYMEACQYISGNGGWPLNCFLTPDGRPFYAATYYPPEPAYGRPSWTQVLTHLANAFQKSRETVEDQANRLMAMIRDSDKNYIQPKVPEQIGIAHLGFNTVQSTPSGGEGGQIFNPAYLENVFYALRERFDRAEGGFGGAPKFPGTMCIQFLLEYHFYTQNPEALNHAELSLQKMIQGGIYDQIGGGFARYATDREWLIPHFEKMLYDNALLVGVIADAYKLTKRSIYRETIEETLGFVLREMTHQQKPKHREGEMQLCFYSAYDADSEGEEGKFYVWDKGEIEAVLGEDAPVFCSFYQITEGGNWEEKNILWRPISYSDFAKAHGLVENDLKARLKKSREKLYAHRAKRVKPGLDDKILLSWNALMISAFARAHEALSLEKEENKQTSEATTIETPSYDKVAIAAMASVLENFKTDGSLALLHTYKNGQAQYAAFLEDYAFLIEALLNVYGICFEKRYLSLARSYTDFVLENFFDPTDNLFYFTAETQMDLPPFGRKEGGLRKKDLYDNATPSANSTMQRNLHRLGILFDENRYKSLSFKMLEALAAVIEKHPSSFAKWASGTVAAVYPPYEIAVVGADALSKSQAINGLFLPNKIIAADFQADASLPLLKGRDTEGGQSLIYVCQNYTCQLPVETVADMKALISPFL